MKAIILILLVIATSAACKKNSASPGHVGAPVQSDIDFAKSFTISSTYSQKSKKLQVKVNLSPGIHAYGEGEKIGKPVKLKISSAGNWQVTEGPVLPNGRKKNLGSLGTSVVIEGDFIITATVKNGFGPIVGLLELQVCSDNACDRPREHGISVETTDKK